MAEKTGKTNAQLSELEILAVVLASMVDIPDINMQNSVNQGHNHRPVKKIENLKYSKKPVFRQTAYHRRSY